MIEAKEEREGRRQRELAGAAVVNKATHGMECMENRNIDVRYKGYRRREHSAPAEDSLEKEEGGGPEGR